jgi:hypothetical protein
MWLEPLRPLQNGEQPQPVNITVTFGSEKETCLWMGAAFR